MVFDWATAFEVSLEPLQIEGPSQPVAGEKEVEAIGKPREWEPAREFQAKLEHAGSNA